MPPHDTVTAVRRFGLGPKPGDIARIAADPRGYVLAGLGDKSAALLSGPDLEPSHVVFTAVQESQLMQRLAAALVKDAAKPAPVAPMDQPGPMVTAAKPAIGDPKPGQIRRDALVDEASARIERAMVTDKPLVERLVMFWSNHFCVSSAKGAVRGIAGAYEREAIRPHVLGRFADMLRAVEQHPAMLIYLDNQVSTGPNSRAGKNRTRGLNENLAREILELHTLGVNGGYTQDDVTNLARLLTGWAVGQANIERSEPGKFFFAVNRHEPGDWTVMGRRYGSDGQRSGERALDDLARHPATAKHIASKLVRHFVSDSAPIALVARLEQTFRDTDGDLAAVTRTLVSAPEAWTQPAAKILPPYDFAIAMVRGLKLAVKPAEVMRLAGSLGQPLWQPPSPKGWPDTDDAWIAPSAIRERLRIAERSVREVDRALDPRAAANDLLGPGLSVATRQAIERAETREQGLELLILAAESMRR